MNNPVATYRLQFHKAFTFTDFERIIPYLNKLGVSTIYASPIFEAVPGSTHGYDSVNPKRINPEIGTDQQLKAIQQQLAGRGISWLQDIVPNHMAFHPNNSWLMDVLEKGQKSLYRSFFDINWNSPVHQGRLMVPFLGSSLEEVIEKGELAVAWQQQRLVLAYYDTAYPLHLRSYAAVLSAKGQPDKAIQALLAKLPDLEQVADPKTYALRCAEFQVKLAGLLKNATAYLETCLNAVNSDPALIQQIADEQVYRLCYHAETDQQINYRRFFTVNGLICLNIQEPEVFEHVHEHTRNLVKEGIFQGLRVDHIDGLYDPTQYLEQLRQLAGEDAYIVVEKILETGEELPPSWPIQGATGYEYLSLVNNVFTRMGSRQKFTQFYNKLLGERPVINRELHDKKAYILFEHMQGELDNLHQLFLHLDLIDKDILAGLPADTLKLSIAEFLIQCPVYRYYGNRLPLDSQEANAIRDIFDRIRKRKSTLAPAVDVLEEALLTKPQGGDDTYNERALRFYQRCMQFSGPLMAKGVEDTLMYTYNRFIGHDEVGDSPEFFGLKTDEFHQKMLDRQARWPLALNGTSTHDTKRGEDVRSRLNVLTDLVDEWIEEVQAWQELNADLKQNDAPDPNDEYFIYQTLIGAYPMPEQDDDNFPNRLTEYLEKALREAKRYSTWNTPDDQYEEAAKAFALSLLDKKRPFWKRFQAFHQQVVDFGIINSLAQVVLKFTNPGVPDVYQGCELWDFSLVDPDNRRPVDFDQREQWLDELVAIDTDDIWEELWQNRYDARIKLWLVHTLLNERKQQVELFTHGHYIPLSVEGRHKQHVLAFARRYESTWYVVAVPLGIAQLCREQETDSVSLDWQDTRIILPDEAPEQWLNQLTKTGGKVEKGIAIGEAFKRIPLAVLKLEHVPSERSAGILMPITSLPSPFGAGDFGPEANAFADFLSRSHQTYWQVLPLNPVESGQGHSPYSSTSSMAGSPLLISPDLLAQDGLLTEDELQSYHLPVKLHADFTEVSRVKRALFDKAYENYQSSQSTAQQRELERFCQQEAYWLNDFALYSALKQNYDGQAWFQWPDAYKFREPDALKAFENEHTEAVNKVKWLQYIFARQWKSLKAYCNSLGIKLFGDLPFYVSYDSVDVWANPEIFSLDESGHVTGMAGVPPDYFNSNGQLWGMPVFRWDVLKNNNYDWWVKRLRKNMELFDLLRLDHFRAFADYWEVAAGEQTAINGEWRQGPGADFFAALQTELGELPFVAEDLGDINDAVYQLRDAFNLPGMKVIQFAFGDNMPQSINSLHNHTPNSIAYTGTHDNNTSRGWYRKDAGKKERKHLDQYVGLPVSQENAHLVLGRMTYASVAEIAILPIQDVLGLDETARLNTPASIENNWTWRLLPGQLTPAVEEQLREWTKVYNRY